MLFWTGNQLYIKEIINNEKLDDIQQKIPLKNNYFLQTIQKMFEMPKLPEGPAEFTIVTVKSIKWSIEYDDEFKNINIKAQKKINDEMEEKSMIDEYGLKSDERFKYCKLLNNDDIILLT